MESFRNNSNKLGRTNSEVPTRSGINSNLKAVVFGLNCKRQRKELPSKRKQNQIFQIYQNIEYLNLKQMAF